MFVWCCGSQGGAWRIREGLLKCMCTPTALSASVSVTMGKRCIQLCKIVDEYADYVLVVTIDRGFNDCHLIVCKTSMKSQHMSLFLVWVFRCKDHLTSN